MIKKRQEEELLDEREMLLYLHFLLDMLSDNDSKKITLKMKSKKNISKGSKIAGLNKKS